MLTQNVYEYRNNCKRFEPGHHFKSRLSMIVHVNILLNSTHINDIIIHQTHYEKSDWSRAFNQFTIACELDMINAISAADIAFIMSSSTSAWLPSPWSVLLRNRMAERFASVSEDELFSVNVYKDFPSRIFLF